MAQPIGVGIIGTGKHGSRYASHLLHDLRDRFSLRAISRRSEAGQQQAKEWGVRCHHDWRQLVADDQVDAVIAVTTPNLNVAIGQLCVELGKPLLLEKPLTTDYHLGCELVALFAAQKLPFTVAQTLRYNSVIRALKAQLPALGRLYHLSASQRLEPSTLAWLEDPQVAGAGVIFHTAVHMFDALRYITGLEVESVSASSSQIHNPGVEDLMCGELLFTGGVRAVVDASKAGPARCGRYEFIGEKGQLQGDQIHGILEFVDRTTIQPLPCAAPVPTILPLLHDWYAFLVGKGANPIPAEEGLAAVRICHAMRLSAERDIRVHLADL